MPKPLVFISHSAKDDFAKKLLAKLYARLCENFEVLLDRKRLQPGTYWRRELDIWLGLCHCGVILFSSDALKSTWVKKEATLLTSRLSWGNDFVLVPVLLPNITHQDLDNEDFSPLAINEIQMLPATSVDETVDEILKQLDPLAACFNKTTPLQELENVIAALLSEIEGRSPEALVIAAEKLGAKFGGVLPNSNYSRRLARELLSADMSQMTTTLKFLVPYFKDKTVAKRILNILSPFWVEQAAVAPLSQVVKRPRKERAVSVNGILPFTQESYVRRARSCVTDWIFVQTTGGTGYEEDADEQADLIEQEILTELRPKMGIPNYAKGIVDLLIKAEIEKRVANEPLFIFLPHDINDKVVEKLRDKFEEFTFFMLSGPNVPDVQKLKLKHIEFLQPELSPGQELAVMSLFIGAMGEVDRTN